MDWNQMISLLGCTNAIVFASVLFLTKINTRANLFLGLLILSLGLNLALSMVLSLGLYDKYPLLHLLPFGVGYGLGPLIYLYVHELTSSKKPNYYHLLFFIGDYPHSLYHLIMGRNSENGLHEFLDKFGFFALLILFYYLWRSRRLIKEHQSDIRNKLSNIDNQTLNWLKQLLLLFIGSIPIFLIMWIIIITIGLEFNDRVLGYAYITFAIFWLGIGGVRQHQLLNKSKNQTTKNTIAKTPLLEERIEKLIHLMEVEKLYLYPDLDIRLLESKLALNAKQISEILNNGIGKNFYKFINEYRVEEFKEKVKSSSKLTLFGVAMESGFNSKATFQRVFKEITGMKPSEFVKTYQNGEFGN